MTLTSSRPAALSRSAFIVVCLGVFVGAMDQTVVVSALPAMIRDLKVPVNRLDQAAWIVDGYLLGYTAALPLIGRLSDVFGRKRVLLGCLAVFLIGSVGVAVAPSLWWLVAARAVQAIGGGGLLPVALALATDDRARRSWTVLLGVVGAAAESGGVLGPLYGGAMTDWAGWRWIFWIHIPLIVVIAAATIAMVRRTESVPQGSESRETAERVDWLGALWIGLGLAALVLGLSQIANRQPAIFVPPLWYVVAGVVLLAGYAASSYNRANPILDVRMFRQRGFAAAALVSLLIGVALIVVMVDIPLLANTALRRTPMEGGLLLMRFSACLPIGGLLGGLAARRWGNLVPGVTGLALVALGMAGVSQWAATIDDLGMTRDLAIAGLGFGLLIVPAVASAIAAAGAKHAGTATAMTHVMRVAGMMVGLAGLTSWGLGRFERAMADVPLPLPVAGESLGALQQRMAAYQAVAEAGMWNIYRDSFAAGAIIAVVAIVPVLGFVSSRRNSTGPGQMP